MAKMVTFMLCIFYHNKIFFLKQFPYFDHFQVAVHLHFDYFLKFFKGFIYSLLERGEREKHQCVRDITH